MIPCRPIDADTKLVGQDVADLHIRTEHLDDGTPCVMSSWEPTPEEIEAIKNGARVHVWILGNTHPPLCLTVGDEPG